jgi:hypothetical protein
MSGSRGTHAVERTSAHRGLVGNSERKSPLGRPSCRRVNDIKMSVQEVGGEIMDWVYLAQDRLRADVSAVMQLHVPQSAGNFLTS